MQFRYVLNDVWYASADNMKFIHHDLNKDFVMPLKANRKVALSEQTNNAVSMWQSPRSILPEGTTREIWLEEVDFPLLLAKEVFKNEDGSYGDALSGHDDLTLTYDQMTTLYQKRWSVEVYHKSLKQNAVVGEIADPDRDNSTQPFLCQSVRLRQAGKLEAQNRRQPFCLEVKDLFVSLEVSL